MLSPYFINSLHYTKKISRWGEKMRTQPMIFLMSLLGFLSPCQAGGEEGTVTQKQPDNIIQFTCQDFSEYADRCSAYTCETPSVSDPTVKMTWHILNSEDHRCLISYTIADVGLKTNAGEAEPVTKTCEYDDTGIGHLNDLMDSMQSGYFLQSTLSEIDGSYNCTVNSEGNPLKPEPYSVLTDN
jgi:hypothetical protein